jgi:hypothetical protein
MQRVLLASGKGWFGVAHAGHALLWCPKTPRTAGLVPVPLVKTGPISHLLPCAGRPHAVAVHFCDGVVHHYDRHGVVFIQPWKDVK